MKDHPNNCEENICGNNKGKPVHLGENVTEVDMSDQARLYLHMHITFVFGFCRDLRYITGVPVKI